MYEIVIDIHAIQIRSTILNFVLIFLFFSGCLFNAQSQKHLMYSIIFIPLAINNTLAWDLNAKGQPRNFPQSWWFQEDNRVENLVIISKIQKIMLNNQYFQGNICYNSLTELVWMLDWKYCKDKFKLTSLLRNIMSIQLGDSTILNNQCIQMFLLR